MLFVKIKRPAQKPCIFIGSSLKDLRRFPAKVKNRVGFALNAVQEGRRTGGGESAERIWRSYGTGTGRGFRQRYVSGVYTVRFAGVVYVLHAFQKKGKKGIATPQQDIELIKSRLRDAELHYRARIENGEGK